MDYVFVPVKGLAIVSDPDGASGQQVDHRSLRSCVHFHPSEMNLLTALAEGLGGSFLCDWDTNA